MSRMWFSSLASLRGSVLRPERTSREREVRHGQVPDWLAEPQWWAWLNKNLAVGKFGGWNSWNPWNTRMKIHPNSWDEEIGYMRVLTRSHRCFFSVHFRHIWNLAEFELWISQRTAISWCDMKMARHSTRCPKKSPGARLLRVRPNKMLDHDDHVGWSWCLVIPCYTWFRHETIVRSWKMHGISESSHWIIARMSRALTLIPYGSIEIGGVWHQWLFFFSPACLFWFSLNCTPFFRQPNWD